MSALETETRGNCFQVLLSISTFATTAGCNVGKNELARLHSFVRHVRDPRYVFASGNFDWWGCADPDCPQVIYEGAQCRRCRGAYCDGCRSEGFSICKYCDAYLCHLGECGDIDLDDILDAVSDEGTSLSMSCDDCEEFICWHCVMNHRRASNCDNCMKTLCHECGSKDGAEEYVFCPCCDGEWCPDCVPDRHAQ